MSDRNSDDVEPKKRRLYCEDNLKNAVNDVERGLSSYREAAKLYNVPFNTIRLQILKKHEAAKTTISPLGRPTVFSKQEEEDLVKLITTCGEWGMPLSQFDLRKISQKILDRTGRKIVSFTNNLPGKDWARAFIKRHNNDLTLRLAQNIKRSRAAVHQQDVKKYFDHLKVTLDGIPASNIINYDETNLSDDPGKQLSIFKRGTKYAEKVCNYTKGSTSIMFAGTAAGNILPLYVVYKSTQLWHSWTEGGPPGTRYNRSKSGWFDMDIFYNWFVTVAVPYCKNLNGAKVLIGDNLSSHLNPEIIRLCEKYNIKFVMLPPNSTHLTQPLDVAFFRPLKITWRKILNQFKSNNPNQATLPKEKFPSLLTELMNSIQENGVKNMKSGFKTCGIFPFNPNQVLKKLPGGPIEDNNSENIVSQSVLEFLKESRKPIEKKQRKKRTQLVVEPGQSVSFEEIQETFPPPQVSTQSTTRKRKSNKQNKNDEPKSKRGKQKRATTITTTIINTTTTTARRASARLLRRQ